MREYMLELILRNVERMRKHRLLSHAAYLKFKVNDQLRRVSSQTDLVFTAYRNHLKSLDQKLNPNYLRFNSAFESGNLERVELGKTINQSGGLTSIQKYNLYCKVDTNTKGHQ